MVLAEDSLETSGSLGGDSQRRLVRRNQAPLLKQVIPIRVLLIFLWLAISAIEVICQRPAPTPTPTQRTGRSYNSEATVKKPTPQKCRADHRYPHR